MHHLHKKRYKIGAMQLLAKHTYCFELNQSSGDPCSPVIVDITPINPFLPIIRQLQPLAIIYDKLPYNQDRAMSIGYNTKRNAPKKCPFESFLVSLIADYNQV